MIVNTKNGKIEGTLQNGCYRFKGVPYAKPPVGKLRFHKPQKPDSWDGVYQADHFRSHCMQGPQRGDFYFKEFYNNPEFQTNESEDSLYLNIWVPEYREEKLPVAVYVHGGAFLGGAGSNLPFVCDELAKSGVIVVTINYRLGALGFLCHPILGVDGENIAGGNYGLWDQLEALRWVKENIENFGGDANRVTAFGQSAGAMSLQALAVCSQTKGLCDQMILQSGGGYKNPLGEYRSIEKAKEIAELLFEELGIDSDTCMDTEEKKQEALEILYSIPEQKMMEHVGKVIGECFREKKGMPFVPVVDGELITQNGNKSIEEGKYLSIPYIIGANGDDLTTEGNEVRLPENNPMHIAGVVFANQVNEEKDIKAYVYYFDRKLPGDDAGAFHSAELWYVFGSLDYCWRPMEKADRELSKKMITYWSNFMKTGNPNGEGKEEWKPCTKEKPYFEVLKV